MLRKLTAIAAGVTAGLVVLSALAQTPPKKKKAAPKKHKHPTPAASATPAPTAAPTADPDLYTPPPEETAAPAPAPAPSAAPSSQPATPAATGDNSPPAADAPAAKDSGPSKSLPPFSVAVLGGWGYNSAAKLGFGARVGYTLPFHVYIGGTFVYHLGESENGATANFFFPGGEAGYELAFGSFMLRPYVGLGALVLHEALPPLSATRMYFGVWPGVTATYSLAPAFFVGLDARFLLSGYSFLGAFATVGARF